MFSSLKLNLGYENEVIILVFCDIGINPANLCLHCRDLGSIFVMSTNQMMKAVVATLAAALLLLGCKEKEQSMASLEPKRLL